MELSSSLIFIVSSYIKRQVNLPQGELGPMSGVQRVPMLWSYSHISRWPVGRNSCSKNIPLALEPSAFTFQNLGHEGYTVQLQQSVVAKFNGVPVMDVYSVPNTCVSASPYKRSRFEWSVWQSVIVHPPQAPSPLPCDLRRRNPTCKICVCNVKKQQRARVVLESQAKS